MTQEQAKEILIKWYEKDEKLFDDFLTDEYTPLYLFKATSAQKDKIRQKWRIYCENEVEKDTEAGYAGNCLQELKDIKDVQEFLDNTLQIKLLKEIEQEVLNNVQ